MAKSGQKLGPVLPNFKSDASKVTSKGMGLKKAYLNKHNLFTIHAGDAGELEFGIVTSFGIKEGFIFNYYSVISSNITQTPDLENDFVKQGLAFISVSLNFLGIKRLTEFVRTLYR